MTLSGRWTGYWEAAGWGRRTMRLTLRLGEGRIAGEGDDCIGPFTFSGHYDEHGHVSMVKQYIGQHQLLYEGTYDGEGMIFGRWSSSPSWSGPFALKLEAADSRVREAVEILPAEEVSPLD
jgi:hypothetical protein